MTLPQEFNIRLYRTYISAELLSQYYEAPVEAKRNPVYQAYRKHFVPGKRGGSLPNLGIYRRPTLNDYMKLAALEQELENAAAVEGTTHNPQTMSNYVICGITKAHFKIL